MRTLLVIDDDNVIQNLFRGAFPEADVTILSATKATEGVTAFTSARPDAVLLDLNVGADSGLAIFRQIHPLDPRVPIIFITGEGTTAAAIEAMAMGAFDYLLKPVNLARLRAVVFQAFEVSRLMRTPARVPDLEPETEADALVGRCPAMQEVYKTIGRVARQNVTVLILGESGTGKELVARAIYHYGARANAPFLEINCAAIPEMLLESELFGHEKGSFTGADRKRVGKFEQCNGGTIFLDEIGDMTPLTQTKILRLLQEQRFERVGGQETIQTDVRLIAATNLDLEQLVAAGRFRKDLFYRLNVCLIRLPPLRERGLDVPLLVEHFVKRFSRDLNKDVHVVSPAALELLQNYSWPGNVRELQSAIKHALIHTTGPVILPEVLPAPLGEKPASVSELAEVSVNLGDLGRFLDARLRDGSANLYDEWHALTDGFLLARVLKVTGGNISQAAKALGIDRGTLRARVKALGLSLQGAVSPDEAP